MSALVDVVQKAACSLTACYDEGDRVVVPTHFLYPSRGHVCVFVAPTYHGAYTVTDGGGAIDALSGHHVDLHDADRFLAPFCTPGGLHAKRGIISSRHVDAEGLPGAIIAVGEASALAALHAVQRYRPRRKRDLYGAVKAEIEKNFPAEQVRQREKVIGQSHRQYRFDFVVNISSDRTLLLDVVTPEPTSLNAKAAANIDVSRLQRADYVQRLVYDDAEDWSPEDINFLSIAATTIPLSRLPVGLQRALRH